MYTGVNRSEVSAAVFKKQKCSDNVDCAVNTRNTSVIGKVLQKVDNDGNMAQGDCDSMHSGARSQQHTSKWIRHKRARTAAETINSHWAKHVSVDASTTAVSDTTSNVEAIQRKRATPKVVVINGNKATASMLTELLTDIGSSCGSDDATNAQAETKRTTPEATLVIDVNTASLIRRLQRRHPALVQLIIVGEMVYADRTVFEGYIQVQVSSTGAVSTAVPCEYGSTKEPDGSTYTGFCENRERHGYGKYSEKLHGVTVLTYEGAWAHNKTHGHGEETTVNGTYEGTWHNDERHGEFKLYDAAGVCCQTSTWHNGVCVKSTDAATTDIGINDTNRSRGVQVKNMKLATGEKFSGTIRYGIPRGMGMATRAIGGTHGRTCYIGCQGESEEINVGTSGDTLSQHHGTFVHGVKEGQGREKTLDDEYIGDWQHDTRHGQGLEVTKHDTYVGSFVNGIRHGYGIQLTANGEEYVGDWHAGVKHGSGLFYAKHERCWEHNIWHHGELMIYDSKLLNQCSATMTF
eukprot:2386-Heterococcus_DN1.PRE.6